MARSSVAPSVLLTAWPQLCFLRHNTLVAPIAAVLLVIMVSDFVVVGPESDPARIRGEKRAADALAKIAAAGVRFVSRGDKSGTHVLEQSLWKQAGVTPAAPWYIESGQGMGATLGLADDRRAYTLTDRATYLAFDRRVALTTLVEGDRALLNVYAVLEG